MKRAYLIYNPTSGRERIKHQLPYIIKRLQKAGYDVTPHETTGPNSAKEAASRACHEQYDLIVAAGGDGTLFEVINGLAESPNRPILGIIPAGTTNDFARALRIPFRLSRALDVICEGEVQALDIGQVNGASYFINVAAGGVMTELTYEVPIKSKKLLGRLAYILKGFRKLFSIRSTRIRLTYGDTEYEQDIFFFLVCNTQSVGGFRNVAPQSKYDDGKFDVIIFEKMNLFHVIKLLVRLFFYRPLKGKHVKYHQLSEFTVELKGSFAVNLDGENGGSFPCHFKNLKHHIRLLAPNKKEA